MRSGDPELGTSCPRGSKDTLRSPVHFWLPCTLTACILQPHQAVEVVIEVQLEALICIPEDDQLQEMATQLKACGGTGDSGPSMAELHGEPTSFGVSRATKVNYSTYKACVHVFIWISMCESMGGGQRSMGAVILWGHPPPRLIF